MSNTGQNVSLRKYVEKIEGEMITQIEEESQLKEHLIWLTKSTKFLTETKDRKSVE